MNTAFLEARDFLLAHRSDYTAAYEGFRWPKLDEFNWALDYFDPMASCNPRTALWIVDGESETRISFQSLAARSNQAANFLQRLGLRRGDRLLVMLGNEPALWEALLGACKLGVVAIPSATQLTPADLRDRLDRGRARGVIAGAALAGKFESLAGDYLRVSAGGRAPGWTCFEDARQEAPEFVPVGITRATDPLLLYFTSGTTARPKMVEHSHQSYPAGHLSTMFMLGLEPGDVHWNISSPGWAKHAWSCLFAPWNAGCTVFVYNCARFQAKLALEALARYEVTSLCAPPTVWRMLAQENLAGYPVKLREVMSAGEPLNPEVLAKVRQSWGLTVRDGYGQTETTALIANSPGQLVKPGSMGRVMPGYRIELIGDEICVDLAAGPLGLMLGYGGPKNAGALRDGYYHTGDIASRDEDGYYTFVGRADDVFKASDYRISPFELESALIEHPGVAEAAVVPSPDAKRFAVPKAFVAVSAGSVAGAGLARDIFQFVRGALAPYKRVRRLQFCELPKTISGKIRRAELRKREQDRGEGAPREELEFYEEDFEI